MNVRQGIGWRSVTVLFALLAGGLVGTARGAERDVAYGADPAQRLDLFVPNGTQFPTVVMVHGGSLTEGDKADDDYRHACEPFVPAGIACANVNYRLAPANVWPAQAEDVAAAVAWVKANISSRGGDAQALFIMGHSSGAMLAAIVGTDERFLSHHGLKTSDLQGVVSMGSVTWDDELEHALSRQGRSAVEAAFARDTDGRVFASLDAYLDHWPIRHLRAGLPPFLFLIAEGEQENPPVLKTNRSFVEQSRALGNRAEYKVLSGRTHYSAIRRFNEPGDPVFAIVAGFVRELSAAERR